MQIRPMKETDLDAVEQISAESSPQTTVWTRQQLGEILSRPSLYAAWVAEQEGVVVGFLYLHLAGDEAEIDNLAVSQAWRRQGIATFLLGTAWEYACGRGISAMYLEVRASNMAALRLYERAKFHEVGIRVRYYQSPEEDAIRLARNRNT